MSDHTPGPVRHTVTVPLPIERAFAVFTEGFDTWWPRGHKIGAADLAEAVLEPRRGGRWYEKGVDGNECEWGRVLVYEPPNRLVLAWHADGRWQYDPDPARASEVEIRFTEQDGHTRVELQHRHLERHVGGGEDIAAAVAAPGGWPTILDGYAKVAVAA
jgi:uncharacterized protein YndB with AHSA1/START domain